VPQPPGQDVETNDPGEVEFHPPPPWSRAAQAIAAVLWPSFLAASLATMLFFAFVDPELLAEATSPPLEVSRLTGYAIGFFFFWVITLVSSAVSVYLVQTAHLPPE
jgi:hypothetical protein